MHRLLTVLLLAGTPTPPPKQLPPPPIKVYEFVQVKDMARKGQSCAKTGPSGVQFLTLGTECPADQEKVVRAFLKRIGAPGDLLKGTTITYTRYHILARIQGQRIWNLVLGASGTSDGEHFASVTTVKGPEKAANTTLHELGHLAWMKAGMDSSWIDNDEKADPAAWAALFDGKKLPKDHPARKVFEAL